MMQVKILRWKSNVSEQNLDVKFEYTGPLTPQRNGKAERKFQTLYGRIRAMFNDAGIEGDFRKGVWDECASTATYYENIIVSKEKKKLLGINV